jgi:hypothetical protein
MKQLLLLFAMVFTISSAWAQMDTLLYEDFQDSIPNMIEFPDPDSIGTNNWVNYDMDFKEDANNRPVNWYWTSDLVYITGDTTIYPEGDSNLVYSSSSWLNGFENGNRNWLITPPIEVVDDQAMLYWKAAPRQGPRYMDGYSVRISTTENLPGDYDENNLDDIYGEFTDLLFAAAQMDVPLPANSNTLEVDSFNYFPVNGYIHAQSFTDSNYYWLEDGGDAYIGLLEPQGFSLADYEGETIYIAFLHDSDDDNLITIDDILVTGTDPVTSTKEVEEDAFQVYTYPNPVDNYLIYNYRLKEKANSISLELYNLEGRLLQSFTNLADQPGNHTQRLDLRSLPGGQYSLVLRVNDQQVTRQIVRR